MTEYLFHNHIRVLPFVTCLLCNFSSLLQMNSSCSETNETLHLQTIKSSNYNIIPNFCPLYVSHVYVIPHLFLNKDLIVVVRLVGDLTDKPISVSLTKHYPLG